MLVRFLVLELLFQALSRYSKILVYTCISTIFCSRTVILQLLVVQVVWVLLQFLCPRCIARSAYVFNRCLCLSADTFHKNPQVFVRLDEADDDDKDEGCTLIVALYQKGTRVGRSLGKKPLTIGFAIYEASGLFSNPHPRLTFQFSMFLFSYMILWFNA